MREIIAALLVLSWLGPVHAQELKRIDIVEYGLYTSKVDRTESAPGTAATTVNMVSTIHHIESTTTVPAQLGSQFGLRYRLVGSGTDNVKLKVVWRIPSPGLHNPETGNIVMEDVSFWDRRIGSTNFNSYGLAHDWEIVPGIWTLEIWDGDRKMVSQGFLIK